MMVNKTLVGIILATTVGCSYVSLRETREIANQHAKYIPSLTLSENKILDELKNNPNKLEHWILDELNYTVDYDQFGGSFCQEDPCDVWSPVGHLIRTKREDCDGILALSHFVLDKKGVGMILHKYNLDAHAVYVYPGENDLWGVISINYNEYSDPVFKNFQEVAEAFSYKNYTSYQVVNLPDDDKTLLYSTVSIEKKSRISKEKKIFD